MSLIWAQISDIQGNNVSKYSLRAPNQGENPQGNIVPNWISINPLTGEISANPPSNVDNISLEILAEDNDGNTRTLEIDLDFSIDDLSFDANQPQIDEKIVKFASLQDQINLEFDGYENYGDKLTKATS